MPDMFYTLISYCIYIIDIVCYHNLLSAKLKPRFGKFKQILLFCLSYVFTLSIELIPGIFPSIPIKAILVFCFFLTLILAFKDSLFKRLLWVFSTCFIIFFSEIIGIAFSLLITKADLRAVTTGTPSQLLALTFSRLILIVIVFALIHTPKKLTVDFVRDFFIIILVDVIYAASISCFFYFDNLYFTTNVAISLSIFAILLISLVSLYLFRKISMKSEEIMTTNLKMQQIEMEHKQNEDMAIVVENLRALRHDMNNHMSVLQGLLSMQEYDDAQKYLSTITEELSVANNFIFTENKVLSVMLNNKISKAHQLGINFETELLTSVTPFSDGDLCAVIGNLLENAIEASSKHSSPYILFGMKKVQNQLLITCENNYTVAPIFENGNLVTTKSDAAYHGIGTKNIRSIVEKYHGTTEFIVNDLFHIKITIPM